MTVDLDIGDLVLKLVPIIIVIAKAIITRSDPATLTPEILAAIQLFDAMIAYLEVAT